MSYKSALDFKYYRFTVKNNKQDSKLCKHHYSKTNTSLKQHIKLKLVSERIAETITTSKRFSSERCTNMMATTIRHKKAPQVTPMGLKLIN